MRTFLITWNSTPQKWPTFVADAAKVRAGKTHIFPNWPIGHSKHLRKGDRLFVLKQSEEPSGIIGAGYAHSDWFPVGQGGPKQPTRTKNAIAVKLETLLDPDIEGILERHALERSGLRSLPFNTRAGGILLKGNRPQRLELAWKQFLDGAPKRYRRDAVPEEPVLEGQPEYRWRRHLRREAWKRKEKIDEVLTRTGKLVCEVPGCGFDYVEKYGQIARRFAHVHHKNALSDAASVAVTRLRDLAVVCANCHAMIHLGGKNRDMNTLIVRSWMDRAG